MPTPLTVEGARDQPSPPPRPRVLLETLRASLASPAGTQHGVAPLGLEAIDRHLAAGGIALGAVHELIGDYPSISGFCSFLLTRIAKEEKPILWCRRARAATCLYGPGLAGLGLAPERLLLALAEEENTLFWALEEGLHCPALAAAVGEARTADLTRTRRLQLAAERHGVSAFLLRPHSEESSASVTRWQVAAAPRAGDGRSSRWDLALVRCRGGVPGRWLVDWDHATGDLTLAAAADDRPAAAEARRA